MCGRHLSIVNPILYLCNSCESALSTAYTYTYSLYLTPSLKPRSFNMHETVSLVDTSIMNSALDLSQDAVGYERPVLNSTKTATIKLPGLFASLAAQPPRLNPFLESGVPREANEWIRGYAELFQIRTFANINAV